MINLHERMLLTSTEVEPATSWSPVGRRIQLSHRGRRKPWSPASVFNTSHGTWWMLMHEKPCLIPILKWWRDDKWKALWYEVSYSHELKSAAQPHGHSLTLVLLTPDVPYCKQCRFRSVGFFRSQLIWICTVYHYVCEFVSIPWIKQSDWLKIRSGYGIFFIQHDKMPKQE